MTETQQFLMAQIASMINRIKAASTGKTIQNLEIDLTGNLIVTYVGDEVVDLGRIVGSNGAPGVSVLDLQLFEDPTDPKAVFLQTTLSNGVVLRTRDSLSGYHGKSIADVYILNEALHFVLDDVEATALPPIPISGLVAISVTGARIENGDLILMLSNDTEINAGLVGDLQGRGVVNARLQGGKLQFAWSDAPTTYVDIADIDGVASVAMVDGKLVYRKSSAPGVDIELAPVVSITGGRVDGNQLIFTTNQSGELAEINVGAVANLKGDTGVGIQNVEIVANDFKITLTDATVITIPVSGLSPVSITGARYDEATNEIYFILSNATEIPSGIKEDLRGASVISLELAANGELKVRFSNAPDTDVVVGQIPFITSYRVFGGKVLVKYNTDPDTEVQVGTMLSIKNLSTQNGKIVVTYTDDSTAIVGNAKSISQISKDEAHILTVHYEDGTTDVVGALPRGEQGVGYTTAYVDPSTGDLILTDTEGNNVNAGQVRMDIDNMIGSIKSFTASNGQVEYMVDHGGTALVWVNGTIAEDDSYSTVLTDRITWTVPFTGGEKVKVIAFAPTGSVITGKGIKNVTEPKQGIFVIELENGVTYEIDTNTVIDVADLPPGIKSMTIEPTGMLKVTLSNGLILEAGLVTQANNVESARVDGNGNLLITLTDETVLNAGSVLANLSITNIEIIDGNLKVTMNSGQVFDAGATGVYPTAAEIDLATGKLLITLSNATVLDAGTVVNPLMGTEYEYVCFEGQTEFPVAHGGYIPLVYMNVALLSKDSLILDDPLKIVVKTPRKAGDIARILLMAKGDIRVAGLLSEADAAPNTFYGKNAQGAIGWYSATVNKNGVPYNFVATEGQTLFNNVIHGGEVEVFVDGALLHTGVDTSQTNKVILATGLSAGQNVRIIALSIPTALASFSPDNYLKVANEVYNNGGSAIANKWTMRQLNVIKNNTIGALLQNNRITLPAGVYRVSGWAAGYDLNANAVKLTDLSTLTDLLQGAGTHMEGSGRTPIEGYFTLTRQSSIVLQHICSKSVASVGLGKVGSGDSNANAIQGRLGLPGTLAQLEFWKLG